MSLDFLPTLDDIHSVCEEFQFYQAQNNEKELDKNTMGWVKQYRLITENRWYEVFFMQCNLSCHEAIKLYMYLGQVTELPLSCYLVLLSIDSKTR